MSEIAKARSQSRKFPAGGIQPKRGKTVRAQIRPKPTANQAGHGRITYRIWNQSDHALKLFHTSAFERVEIVKSGLPAEYVKVLSLSMRMPIEKFYRATGLVRPTVDRKIRASKLLNQDESERVMGIARLVGQAQSIVQESGEAEDFDAARWVGEWLERPLPALGGRSPGELMDTMDGRALVSDLLAQQQSGAYG